MGNLMVVSAMEVVMGRRTHTTLKVLAPSHQSLIHESTKLGNHHYKEMLLCRTPDSTRKLMILPQNIKQDLIPKPDFLLPLQFYIKSYLIVLLLLTYPTQSHTVDYSFPVWNSSSMICSGDSSITNYDFCSFNDTFGFAEMLPLSELYSSVYPEQAARMVYTNPIAFFDTTSTTMVSFNTFFVFSSSHTTNHPAPALMGAGMAFIISSSSSPAEFSIGDGLGLFQFDATTGDSLTPVPGVFAVEFDTYMSPNIDVLPVPHVGIDLSSLASANASAIDSTTFLDSTVGMWIDYNASTKCLELFTIPVTMIHASAADLKPLTPVVTTCNFQLSSYVHRTSYIGFSTSSIGQTWESNRIYYWTFKSTDLPGSYSSNSWFQYWWWSISKHKKAAIIGGSVVATILGLFGLLELCFWLFCERIKRPATQAEQLWPVRRRSSLPLAMRKSKVKHGAIPSKKIRDSLSVATPLQLWETPLDPNHPHEEDDKTFDFQGLNHNIPDTFSGSDEDNPPLARSHARKDPLARRTSNDTTGAMVKPNLLSPEKSSGSVGEDVVVNILSNFESSLQSDTISWGSGGVKAASNEAHVFDIVSKPQPKPPSQRSSKTEKKSSKEQRNSGILPSTDEIPSQAEKKRGSNAERSSGVLPVIIEETPLQPLTKRPSKPQAKFSSLPISTKDTPLHAEMKKPPTGATSILLVLTEKTPLPVEKKRRSKVERSSAIVPVPPIVDILSVGERNSHEKRGSQTEKRSFREEKRKSREGKRRSQSGEKTYAMIETLSSTVHDISEEKLSKRKPSRDAEHRRSRRGRKTSFKSPEVPGVPSASPGSAESSSRKRSSPSEKKRKSQSASQTEGNNDPNAIFEAPSFGKFSPDEVAESSSQAEKRSLTKAIASLSSPKEKPHAK